MRKTNGRRGTVIPLRQDWRALTKREQEILRLLAEGYTTREIAGQLQLSPKTVETHRAHIRIKLGLRRLAQLIQYAIQEGLVKVGAGTGRRTGTAQRSPKPLRHRS